MKNNLVKVNENLLKQIDKNGTSDVLKPLKKEIQLFDCFVSETYDTKESIISKLKVGDDITTKKDINNLFDEYAVALLNSNGKKIGYIPELYSSIVTKLINAGKVIKAKISNIDRDFDDDIPIIKIDIFLVDF